MPLDNADCPVVQVDEATALLIRARTLVARGWCRGALARSRLGRPVNIFSGRAVKWCASGGLQAARLGTSDLEYRRAVYRLSDAIGDEAVHEFNDRQETVEPILAAFDRAIAMGGR